MQKVFTIYEPFHLSVTNTVYLKNSNLLANILLSNRSAIEIAFPSVYLSARNAREL